MNCNNIKITILKEIRGIVRDKKSLQKLILYPLLIPLVIFLFAFLFDTINESTYTVGINYDLSVEEEDILKEIDNVEMKKYSNKDELEKAYNDKEISGYIIKDNNTYTVYANTSVASGEIIMTVSNEYLETYNRILGIKYLESNNIDPANVYNSIFIENKNIVEEDINSMATVVFSLVMAYIIMIVAMVCIVVVTDATSGEKERGTLETILTFPIKSSELVLGKYLSAVILSFIIGLIAYLLSIPSFVISKKLFTSFEDVVFNTSIDKVILVVLVIFLCSLLTSGVCMALTGKSKTYKEAQSALQFISILPLIPYFLNIMEIDSFILNIIPIANCGGALNAIVNNTISTSTLLTIIVTTMIYIILILSYISKQYRKEETLFS